MAVASTLSHMVVVASVFAVAQSYDCNAELWDWETLWTPDWKAWCCQNEPPRGCPTTSTVTSTTMTATQTTTETETRTATSTVTQTTTMTGNPCDVPCVKNDVNATCAARLRWLSMHTTLNEAQPCQAAEAIVIKECPNECGACTCEATTTLLTTTTPAPPPTQPTTVWTPPPTPPTTVWTPPATPLTTVPATEPPTTQPASGCSAVCNYKGDYTNCGDRILWAAAHEMKDEQNPCEAAQVVVTMECDMCGKCTPQEAGCDKLVDHEEIMKRFELQQVAAPGDSLIPTMSAMMCLALLSSVVAGVMAIRRRSPRNVYVNAPGITHEEELMESMVEA